DRGRAREASGARAATEQEARAQVVKPSRYGWRHRRERKRVATVVEAGRAICSRCGLAIFAGTEWDLDHDDYADGWVGPAHRSCNRAAGGRKGAKRRRRRSKAW